MRNLIWWRSLLAHICMCSPSLSLLLPGCFSTAQRDSSIIMYIYVSIDILHIVLLIGCMRAQRIAKLFALSFMWLSGRYISFIV